MESIQLSMLSMPNLQSFINKIRDMPRRYSLIDDSYKTVGSYVLLLWLVSFMGSYYGGRFAIALFLSIHIGVYITWKGSCSFKEKIKNAAPFYVHSAAKYINQRYVDVITKILAISEGTKYTCITDLLGQLSNKYQAKVLYSQGQMDATKASTLEFDKEVVIQKELTDADIQTLVDIFDGIYTHVSTQINHMIESLKGLDIPYIKNITLISTNFAKQAIEQIRRGELYIFSVYKNVIRLRDDDDVMASQPQETELTTLHGQCKLHNDNLAILSEELNKEVEDNYNKLYKLDHRIQEMTKEGELNEEAVNTIQKELDIIQKERDELASSLSDTEETKTLIGNKNVIIDTLKHKLEECEKELTRYTDRKIEYKAKIDIYKSKIDNLKARQDKVAKRQKILQGYSVELETLTNVNIEKELHDEIANLSTKLEEFKHIDFITKNLSINYDKHIKVLDTEIVYLKNKLAVSTTTVSELKKELTSAADNVKRYKFIEDDNIITIEQLREDNETQRKQIELLRKNSYLIRAKGDELTNCDD